MKAANAQPPTDPIRLIVLLGNPGREYEATRHNVARRLSDGLTDSIGAVAGVVWKEKFSGTFTRLGDLVLLIPDTWMNESGRSVQAARSFFRLEGREILVAFDDLETPFGGVQLTWAGGHRGHNGVRSVAQALGGPEFWQLRIGIDRPPGRRRVADWVLDRFSAAEEADLARVVPKTVSLIAAAIEHPTPRRLEP